VGKIIGSISFIVLGIFVIKNPIFTTRGGTTDLSFMNFNILLGFILIVIGILLVKSNIKKKDIK